MPTTYRAFPLLLLLLVTTSRTSFAADDYKLGPDSERQEGVPVGKVTNYTWDESKVYPGTKRSYSVYVPQQYDGSTPAALMVFQDGGSYLNEKGHFRATVVMDNLIHKKQMPVTIGVFINPGEVPAAEAGAAPRRNRSYEYDRVSEDYAKFLLEEILPEVSKTVKITDDPELRGSCGISSGGICAFSVAWYRPDSFRRVISHVGSFANIQGGHVYHALIRKTEKKPLRIFLQEGSNDLDNHFGNWPLANQQMAKSLEFKKYDYKFEYGDGGHNGKHGGALLPDTFRWLFRDAPGVVAATGN